MSYAVNSPSLGLVSLGSDARRGREAWQAADKTSTTPMRIMRADPTDMQTILGLIEEARNWLWVKDTDQWAKPWPDEKARDARVLRGLQAGETWIVRDEDTPAATITITPRINPAVWSIPACTCDLSERAVFVHRLITARKYSGLGLSAGLLDWAGLRSQRLYGAKWIRTDVWSTNKTLHDFLRWRGFERCGFCADPEYPSGTLFQKPVSTIKISSTPIFREEIAIMPMAREYGKMLGEPSSDPRSAATSSADEDIADPNLLFRVYIPSGLLYAAEAGRLLALFRDWLTTTCGHGIRQSGYRTALGEVYEFFTDTPIVGIDLQERFDSFSSFLSLCADNQSAAADLLAEMNLNSILSSDLVSRFSREVRRLQIDLRHERERRILSIRQSLEQELVENHIDLRQVPSKQLNALFESFVPGPSAPESLGLLAGPETVRQAVPITVNINPQIISALKSTIVQNVQGVVHLDPQAKEILAFIDRFGRNDAVALRSAIYELEDVDAPAASRSAAGRRLKRFLGQCVGTVHDLGLDLLEKYLEKKLGL